MKLRKLPGALALGLLASVLGHAAGYGNGHAMGGAYHETFLTLAYAGVGIFVLAALAVALAFAGAAAEGTIVASRLRSWIPGIGLLAVATSGWFAVAEAIEGSHATGTSLTIVVALLIAIFAVRAFALAVIAIISSIAIAIDAAAFAPRSYQRYLSLDRPLAVPSIAHTRRLFARPPPESMQYP